MKNFKFTQRLLAYLTAGVLSVTALPALAEGSNEDNNTNVIKYAQMQEFSPLTVEEFEKLLDKSFNYLEGRLPNSTVNKDFAKYTQCLNCVLYCTNVDYPKDERTAIEGMFAHGEDGNIGRLQNMVDAMELIRDIQDNNQSVIKSINEIVELEKLNFENIDKEVFHKYLVKVAKNKKYNLVDAVVDYNNLVEKDDDTKVVIIDGKACLDYKSGLNAYIAEAIKDENYDINEVIKAYIDSLYEDLYGKLVDPSKFCYNEDDEVILHELFIKWIESYGDIMVKGTSPMDSEVFQELYRQLTTLGSEEKLRDINEMGTGAEWIGQKVIGVSTFEMLVEVLERMDASRITNYFDVNDNFKYIGNINPNCHDEYEAIVCLVRDIKKVAVDEVNNTIMFVLNNICLEKEAIK